MIPQDIHHVAVMIIYQNELSHIEKIKGFNYHIEYYKELAKKDQRLNQILSKYDLQKILENPSLTYSTINKDLYRQGISLVLSMAPQIDMPTNVFFANMCEIPSDFQRDILKKYQTSDIEFFDFGVYNESTDSLESIMDESDYQKPNAYLIERYLVKKRKL